MWESMSLLTWTLLWTVDDIKLRNNCDKSSTLAIFSNNQLWKKGVSTTTENAPNINKFMVN